MTTNLEHPFSTQAMAEQVLRLAERGWPLLPCVPQNKIPLIKNWRKRATVDFQTLIHWLTRWPQCNWAIIPGWGSGFFVLDVDGQPDEDAIRRFSINGKALLETLSVGTGKGRHVCLLCSHEIRINNTLRKLTAEALRTMIERGTVPARERR